VSLMAQYMPFAQAEKYPEINRRITQEEYDLVADHLLELGLEDGYVQELGASDEKYLPAFDLTGVATP
ncbi:MAG: radical SAM protein, partial [Clostridia bacterium]